MAIRKYRFDIEEPTELNQEQPLYEDYVPEEEHVPKLSELLFFLNIAIFCVFTILFSFIFLAFKIESFLAFTLAIVSSLLSLRLYKAFTSYQAKK